MTSAIHFDRRALEKRAKNQWRDIPAQVAERPVSRLKTIVAYGVVVAGVAVAAFYITPSHAAGSMAQDVRVVTASPSIVYFGDTREGRKAQADIMRDDNKALHNMELENQRSVNRRNEEADKAYYDRLKDQRKGKCTYC